MLQLVLWVLATLILEPWGAINAMAKKVLWVIMAVLVLLLLLQGVGIVRPVLAAEVCEQPWDQTEAMLKAADVKVIAVAPEDVKTIIANLPAKGVDFSKVDALFFLRKGDIADLVFVNKDGCVLGETGTIPDPENEIKRLFTPGAPAWHNPADDKGA